jgi:hypothetical protein
LLGQGLRHLLLFQFGFGGFVMPFANRDLARLAYGATGFTLWHYRSGDPLATVCAPNYLADATGDLQVSDWIMVTASDGARLVVVASRNRTAGRLTLAALACDARGAGVTAGTAQANVQAAADNFRTEIIRHVVNHVSRDIALAALARALQVALDALLP